MHETCKQNWKEERKKILENKQLLGKRDNPSKSATNQRLKLNRCVAFAHIISRNILIRFKKHSDKSIAQATVFKSLTVAVSSKGLVLLSLLKRNLTNECMKYKCKH